MHTCTACFACLQSKNKTEKVAEVVQLGPTTKEGEDVFAVVHIFASFNDTFIVCDSI